MHTARLAWVVLVVACGAADAERRGAGDRVAAHGEVCSSAEGGTVATCAPGLFCCYPCGIDGCDSVCHTAEECEADHMRP